MLFVADQVFILLGGLFKGLAYCVWGLGRGRILYCEKEEGKGYCSGVKVNWVAV